MPKTTPEQNKALVLEAFDTLFNKRDYAAAESMAVAAERAENVCQEGQLNITAKFEAGLDEVRNSASLNQALRNLSLVESSVALKA
jgi:hypothetical protein